MMQPQTPLLTSPLRGEVGAKRRVRGCARLPATLEPVRDIPIYLDMFKLLTSTLVPRILLFRKEVAQLWRAFRAPETPLYLKAATLFVAFYLINPFDLVPDFLPFLGIVDDLILVPLMVSWIVSRLPVPAKVYAGKYGPTVDGKARRM
jgi:uncharacterized membrane protein YkvA (DUF1232 family)